MEKSGFSMVQHGELATAEAQPVEAGPPEMLAGFTTYQPEIAPPNFRILGTSGPSRRQLDRPRSPHHVHASADCQIAELNLEPGRECLTEPGAMKYAVRRPSLRASARPLPSPLLLPAYTDSPRTCGPRYRLA